MPPPQPLEHIEFARTCSCFAFVEMFGPSIQVYPKSVCLQLVLFARSSKERQQTYQIAPAFGL